MSQYDSQTDYQKKTSASTNLFRTPLSIRPSWTKKTSQTLSNSFEYTLRSPSPDYRYPPSTFPQLFPVFETCHVKSCPIRRCTRICRRTTTEPFPFPSFRTRATIFVEIWQRSKSLFLAVPTIGQLRSSAPLSVID